MLHLLALFALLSPPQASPLDGPTLGTALVIGPGHAGDRTRLDLRMHALGVLGDWRLGGEVLGTIEGDEAGEGRCGRLANGGISPAIAESCIEPSLALHALAGHTWGQDAIALRLEAGGGIARRWQLMGSRQTSRWALSWVARAMPSMAVGDALGAIWRIGPSVELAGFDASAPRFGVGLVFEATSYD
jgi:hypothetical protein